MSLPLAVPPVNRATPDLPPVEDQTGPLLLNEFDPVQETEPWVPVQHDVVDENGEKAAEKNALILIVEDHVEVRAYLRSLLRERYEVLEAEDGVSGLEMALAQLPDLVISDLMMPGMDGYALCETLKKREQTCHIPVILLTARASSESRLTGLETGARRLPFQTL